MADTPTLAKLAAVPRSERRDALEAVVVAEFRSIMQMTDAEELPLDVSFFELGLTSLRLTEIKQRLESLLACGISANDLFNQPTVDQLVVHLTDEVLTDLFQAPVTAAVAAPAAPAASKSAVDDLLKSLYQA